MKVLSVFEFYMICCLEPMSIAILLLSLFNAITASNSNNTIIQYWLLPTAATSNITNTNAESNCKSSTAATTLTLWDIYFTLCINNNPAGNFTSYKNIENLFRHIVFEHSRRINESEFTSGNEGNVESWSLEHQWKRKERTRRSNIKGDHGVAGVGKQHYYDDISEITLCMLLAIFVEIIPLTLRYVRKRTVLCWRRLQLFCCCSHWSFSRALFQRKRLQTHRAVSLNCVCNLIKLVAIKLKKRQDHIQKLPYVIRQDQLTVFAVLTGKIFAIFVQGATTPSVEITISYDAGIVCTTTGKHIFLSGVPAAVAESCKKTCHNFLLTSLVMVPVTLAFNMHLLTDHVLYILVTKEARLFYNKLALFRIIYQQMQSSNLYYACQYCNGIVGSKIQQETYSPGRTRVLSDCNRWHSHKKYGMIVMFQLLLDLANTMIETEDNNYIKIIHNNSRYLKPSKKKLIQLKKRKNGSKGISCSRHIARDICKQVPAFLKSEHKYFRSRRDALVKQKNPKPRKLMRRNPKLRDPLSSKNLKFGPRVAKSIKSTNRKRPANLNIQVNSKSTVVLEQSEQYARGKNTDWKDCVHAIMKFDLCCIFWCFYCYCRCNCISGRNSSGCCYTWYWCWHQHFKQYACNYPHCIYCYYYRCYYCLYRCYCCCCLVKLHSTSMTCPYGHLATRSNNQPFNLRNNAKTKQQPSQSQTKKQRVLQQVENNRYFRRLQDLTSNNCPCFEYSVWFACRPLHCYKSLHYLHSIKDVTTVTTAAAKLNGDTLLIKRNKCMQFARCSAKHISKYIFHQLIHMADCFYRNIIAALRVKISVPRSTLIVIKVSREQKQKQQQQQMASIANDQQLKMNNLCKIFCNNWKRHRRRRRRRRRRRINIQEQQQQQSVAFQQQHMSNEKDTLFHIANHRFRIWDPKACKTISRNVPSLHFILSKAAAGSILASSMLAGIRLANTKIIAFSDRTRKDVMNPAPTPALLTSSTSIAPAGLARVGRSRARPNLVWLFIGLVWFEGPKYVNCNINGSSQSQQPSTRNQAQAVTHTTHTPLTPLAILSHQQQLRQTQPPRIVTNLPLLTTNHRIISNSPVLRSQKAGEVSTSFKSKVKQRKTSNTSSKSIRTGNCLSSRRRASIMAATVNEKQTRASNANLFPPTDHKHYEWHEMEADVDFLDEEAHATQSDRVRLESIKRQILNKLGLKQRPNVSHPLPKQFIWDTIYRADGIRRVVSEFDFNENEPNQWDIRAKANTNGLTKLPFRLDRQLKGEKKTIENSVIRSNNNGHNIELASSHMQIKNMANVNVTVKGRVLPRNLHFHRINFETNSKRLTINKTTFCPNLDVEKNHNREYKPYVQKFRFDESHKTNDNKITNKFTYLTYGNKPKAFLKDGAALNGNIIFNANNNLLDIDTDKMNYSSRYIKRNDTEAYLDSESLDEYNLHHEGYGMPNVASPYETEDYFGDTQEIITFAEKGMMIKQHRLVEFSPRTNGVPNQKLFVRKAEIHIRIDKAEIGGTEKKSKKNFGCGGKKAKLKLWIFQFAENNTTKKDCEQSPQLRASFKVDTVNLGWQKFDITSTIRNWYARVPMEKLRLLIDCTGCGKQYVLHLFEQPIDISKHKKYHSMNHNDLVVQRARSRNSLNKAIKINTERNAIQTALPDRPFSEQFPMNCSSIFDCNVKNYSTSLIDGYKFKRIQMQLFQQHHLERNRHHQANRPQLQQKNTKNRSKHQYAQYLQPQIDINLQIPRSDEQYPNRPFLVLRTETKPHRRVRRRAIDCVGATHGQCCKESFYVSFKALGWDDWIIAPRGYFANYCRGDCTGPFRTPDTFQTFHAHFIEEYRKIGLLNGMQPCCAPVKFSSMSLIYYGNDGIIKRDLPKMVVDECGCP